MLTVAELLDGRGIDYPSRFANVTFKRAPKNEMGKDAWLSFESGHEEA
jgi:hypothetical protein